MKSVGMVEIQEVDRNYELWQSEKNANQYTLEVTELSTGEYCFAAGLWFENNKLIDYDGVFQLSKNTVKAIRKLGFTVPRDME